LRTSDLNRARTIWMRYSLKIRNKLIKDDEDRHVAIKGRDKDEVAQYYITIM